ncbi:MAG TPA: FAD-dependent oxidoreductase, partial [Saccharofermentans sp.]|nr:FAD-dependent oxidoreductase [Saccharofermentans sp.]
MKDNFMKIVIVGGVAGGASAAARLRRLDENAQIILFERSGFVSYANCGLPYYIGGVISNKAELTLQTPESLWNRFRIEVRTHQEVTHINTQDKMVTVHDLDNEKVYEESYDKLILSPGAKPIIPNLSGTDSRRLFTLRTVEDSYRIRDYVTENNPQSVVIVGGGFIGLEVAENLNDMGIRVTIVQRSDQLLDILDYDMATFTHSKIRQKGISLKLGSNVIGFTDEANGITTHLENDSDIKSDFVLMAVGVLPDSSLAKAAGLQLGIKGSILVNDKMETSVQDIYAVGDAVQVIHSVSGQNAVISLA